MKNDSEFETAVERYIDGTIAPEELAALNARLLLDADARQRFAEMVNLDSAIAAVAVGWQLEGPSVVRFPQAPIWWAAAAALVLLIGGTWWWRDMPRIYATVYKGAGIMELAEGAHLGQERHALKVGSLELITKRGAKVVIEAPAEFCFENEQRLRMFVGRLAAEVPPSAKGFTVLTPSGDAIDLGTRFGVDVPASGASEIHVFQGEVIANTTGNKERQSLRGGDALLMNGGTGERRELRSSAFIQSAEMGELSAGLAAGQKARSEGALAALKKDPALITLIDFEAERAEPGVYRTVQGRWPGSHAPEFIHLGDHLKIDVGGDQAWRQLTLAAWVRIDRLGAPYQSLFHTDGWSEKNPGQVHWMINRNTTMRLALFGNILAPDSGEKEGHPDSQISVLPEQGRWVHLAVVYDCDAATVRFFFNGRFDSETREKLAHPARLGPGQIGNWERQDRKLSGRIDELVFLGRAMSDSEVRALFEAGNPYR